MIDRYTLLVSDLLAELLTMAELWKNDPPASQSANLMTGRGVNIFAGPPAPQSAPDDFSSYLVGRVQQTYDKARSTAELMGFDGILPEIERAKLNTQRRFSYNKVPDDLRHLRSRFRDELASTYLLHVRGKDREFYGVETPFGDAVGKKFPKATEDLVEAGNCLAMQQYTAVVFHLMRAMEVMVQRVAKKLRVNNLDREWGKLLSDIGKAIEPMPKGPKRNRWSEAHTHLYHVKQAWRNDTMHPKQTYTEVEARAIYTAVGVFSQSLAKLI